jgi:hypothetical protein
MNPQFASIVAIPMLVAFAGCMHSPPSQPAASPLPKVAEAKAGQRTLWEGHVFWIRNVAFASIENNAAAREASEKEVVINATQIGQAVEPFYGKSASDKLVGLLTLHYGALRDHLDATIAGNDSQQQEAVRHLTTNAAEIATFLSGANPYLPKDVLVGMLMAHAGHHITQFQQLLQRDYTREAHTWRGMKQQIDGLADALTDALARQFPEKFQSA